MNLVSTVTHEFGHIMGLDHDYGYAVMGATLTPNFALDTRLVDNLFSLWGNSRSPLTFGSPVASFSRNDKLVGIASDDDFSGFSLVEGERAWLLDRNLVVNDKNDADTFTWKKLRRGIRELDADLDDVDERLLDEEVLQEIAVTRVALEN